MSSPSEPATFLPLTLLLTLQCNWIDGQKVFKEESYTYKKQPRDPTVNNVRLHWHFSRNPSLEVRHRGGAVAIEPPKALSEALS